MESTNDSIQLKTSQNKNCKKIYTMRYLRLSLKYRPKIFNLIINLQHKIKQKNNLLKAISRQIKKVKQHASIQTEDDISEKQNDVAKDESRGPDEKTNSIHNAQGDILEPKVWNGENEMSIAEQVKEAAQNAMAQSGMVYVESAGMYYDYKTGYYYNSELGLYYHTDTSCYYYFNDEKQEFVFHSYPDTSMSAAREALKKHEKKKAKKHKQGKEDQANGDTGKSKKQKSNKYTKETKSKNSENKDEIKSISKENSAEKEEDEGKVNDSAKVDLEDGECSDTASESSVEESCDSTSTASDDESVAKHHPPCMRVIVRETTLPKLKVGSLFLITKDGGTIGREGEQHTILLKEHNVSRNHLHVTYDTCRNTYVATDLGSKNGTVLNGTRMSESQVVSPAMEIPHGSTLQLGETKLLCHIHPGNDTCGHCEPGLVMAADDKDKKVAYTRTCSVQKQHQLELARLKNKYAPEPLAIEDGSYTDRAKARRETVGSSHHSEKTEQTDLDTTIAPENKGFKMLEKMGWDKEKGLGKYSQGNKDPIPLISNESKVGLGAVGSAAPVTVGAVGSVPLKMARRTKPLRPPAKLFLDPLEDDDE